MAIDSDEIRRVLTADRDVTTRQLAELTDAFDDVVAAVTDVATDDEHDPEGATIAYERSRTAALATQAKDHLADIAAALARLDAGTYDSCEHCGGAIAEERLAARPVARTCISCAAGRH